MTPKDKLPEETTDEIKADSIAYMHSEIKGVTGDDDFSSYHLQYAYIAGATAWAPWKVAYDELKTLFDKHLTKEQELLKAAEASVKVSQRMADALEKIKTLCEKGGAKHVAINDAKGMAIYHSLHLAHQALQQFKDGGKEVVPVKEIEYMPILSAELRELKNIPDVPMRVPMHLLNEHQAGSNHGQTLARLKERGGLSVKEAISLITLKNWGYYRSVPMKEAVAMLNELITNPTK